MWFAIALRHQALCLGLVLLAIALAGMPNAQAQLPESTSIAGETTAAKALAVLEKHCASCHQSERTAPAPPKSALRAILDLDALAREPDYVLPGNPDGSKLVQMMMWRHLDPKPPEPDSAIEIAPDEIAAVRMWVKGLPRVEACRAAKLFDTAAIADLAARAIAKAGGDKAKDMRFVSLAPAYNSCATLQQLTVFRVDVAQALNSLSWATVVAETEVVDGSGGALLAFRLSDLGWSQAHWAMIEMASPYSHPSLVPLELRRASGASDPVVHGGWLVGALTSGTLFISLLNLPPRDDGFIERLGMDIAAARSRRIARHAERAVSPLELAISYRHRLDLSRLANEYGVRTKTVMALSAGISPELDLLARRAQQGTVPREMVEDAFRLLAKRSNVDLPAGSFVRGTVADIVSGSTARPPDLVLLADTPSVRAGDKVSFTVTMDRDCHLTVINVDTLGRGTVIFPSEFEPDSRLQAGRVLRLPPEGAGYEFRARQQGTEAIVATCNPVSSWAAGIMHDFERQRFTVLGDYEAFVRKSLISETAAAPPRDIRRRLQRRGKPPAPPPVRPLAGQVGRTGILIDVR